MLAGMLIKQRLNHRRGICQIREVEQRHAVLNLENQLAGAVEINAHPHSRAGLRLVPLGRAVYLNYDRSVSKMAKEMTDEEIREMVKKRFVVSGYKGYMKSAVDREIEKREMRKLTKYAAKLRTAQDIPNEKGDLT
jgi:hypothetical protein